MTSQTGPWAIINKKSGTALTVADGPDPRAITCSPYDGSENQKFYLVPLEYALRIRTARVEESVGVLGDLLPNSELFAAPTVMQWTLIYIPIFGPGKYYQVREFDGAQNLCMSLANSGSLDPGTPVKLEFIQDGNDYQVHQVWEFRAWGSD